MKNNIPKALDRHPGVYQILNTENGKCYIGSTKCFRERFIEHKYELNADRHANKYLQLAYNSSERKSFEFNCLAALEKLPSEGMETFYARLLEVENELILKFKSNQKQFGYNLRVYAWCNRGISHSESALTRIKGRKMSDKTREKMSLSRQGEKHPQAKLTEQVVREIKILLRLGYRSPQLAAHYQVGKHIVKRISSGKGWNNVEVPTEAIETFTPPDIKEKPGSHLNKGEIKLIKYLINKDVSTIAIARYLNRNVKRIGEIKRGGKRGFVGIVLSDADIKYFDETIRLEDLSKVQQAYEAELFPKFGKKGSKNKSAKLTDEQVKEIKRLLIQKFRVIEIANKYQVSEDTIRGIKKGRTWSHIE